MAPSDLPPPHDPAQQPPAKPTGSEGQDNGSDHQMHVIGLMVGTALMFIGFLNVFLSISGGFEINVVPFLIYFGGLAVWANAAIETLVIRYLVMTAAIALALALFHYGEVLFWHKQVVFWGTVVIVMYFMFREPKKPAA
jgi:cation transport ATPase